MWSEFSELAHSRDPIVAVEDAMRGAVAILGIFPQRRRRVGARDLQLADAGRQNGLPFDQWMGSAAELVGWMGVALSVVYDGPASAPRSPPVSMFVMNGERGGIELGSLRAYLC